MASANERRIIELILKASGDTELKRIQDQLAGLKHSAEESQTALEKLGETAKHAFEFFGAEEILEKAYEGFEKITEAVKESVEQMSQLAITISKVGVSAEDLQKLQFAAKGSGVDLEALNKGLTRLAANMVDLNGKNSAATKTLRDLGITSKTTTLDAMMKLADVFHNMPDGAQKTALAVQQFGQRMGTELIPLLNKGSENLKEMGDEAEKLGIVLSGEALAGARELDKQMDDLGQTIHGAENKIVAGMSPALVNLAKHLTEAAASAGDFTSLGRAIGDMLNQVVAFCAGAIAELNAFKHAADNAMEGINAGKAAIGALAHGELQAAKLWEDAAVQRGNAMRSWFNNAQAIRDKEEKDIRDSYQQTIKDLAEAGAKLNAQGRGTGSDDPVGAQHGKVHVPKPKKEPVDHTYRDAMKALEDELKSYERTLGDVTKKELDHQDALQKTADELNAAADPMKAYLAGMTRLAELKAAHLVTDKAVTQEERRLQEQFDNATDALAKADPVYKAHQQALEAQAEAAAKLKEQWGFVADAVGEATNSIITGSENVATAMRRMVATIMSELARLAAQSLFAKLFGNLLGGLAGGATGGWANVGVNPNVFGGGLAMASGGVIGGPVAMAGAGGFGIAGEAGPEAVMPLQRDSSGNLGVSAPSPKITVNNYASADVAVRQGANGATQIDILRKQIADDIRRGGNPVAAALEGTYRVGRYAGAYS